MQEIQVDGATYFELDVSTTLRESAVGELMLEAITIDAQKGDVPSLREDPSIDVRECIFTLLWNKTGAEEPRIGIAAPGPTPSDEVLTYRTIHEMEISMPIRTYLLARMRPGKTG